MTVVYNHPVVSPERYQEVKRIFEAALERAAAERGAFVARACGHDVELRQQVERLLDSDARPAGFIDQPALVSVARLFEGQKVENAIGTRLGPYEILSEIGRGGMGTVYLASRADDQYRKLVAIKIVNPGVETGPLVERFRRERQILANLEHPNIAQLLDGGACPDGRPYLVMEYVGGMPIDEYCGSRRLGVAERLKLFRTVCSAVHHAHQNLIVHRDLKPRNILVKGDGTIKLLDFGIAKLLNPEPAMRSLDRTATSMRILTPEYASPEQARGDPVTAASDVYLLGVVLYELLTGRQPHNLGGRPLIEVLSEREPDPPSTVAGRPDLRKTLAGDLDAIVLRAMRRDPAERYGSAEAMGEDIQRYLYGLPVAAHADTSLYRVSKFVRRHRAALAAALAAAVLLMGGLGTAAWQVRAAREGKAQAERQLEEMRRRLERLERQLPPAERRP